LASTAQPPASDLLERVDAFQAGFDEANRLSGVFLVVRGDSTLLHHAFGARNPLRRELNRLDTPIPVASITKIFTQVALTQLVVERKLGLSDPVSRWIPDFPRGDSITVAQLFSHRAGIPHRVATAAEERTQHSSAEVAAFAARHPLAFPPGSQSSYGTGGSGVFARVLDRADGRPYHELLRARMLNTISVRPSELEFAWDRTVFGVSAAPSVS
jgi:CubicO group peptidase (beta-lactamase class C family)